MVERSNVEKKNLRLDHRSYHVIPQKPQYAPPNSSDTYRIMLSKHLPLNAILNERKRGMGLDMIRRVGGALGGI